MLQAIKPAKALILDSGIGGLSIAKAIRAAIPDVLIDYLADYEFFPYGDKSETDIQERVACLLEQLIPSSQPDLIVIACNTASTTVLDKLRLRFDLPFVGVVPAIKPAVSLTQSGVIGVLATPGTVARTYTQNLIKQFGDGKRILLQGSARLVEQAELKLYGQPTCITIVQKELDNLFSQPFGDQIDTVVLGCTHFPLLKDELQITAMKAINWVDSSEAIARRTLSCLSEIKRRLKQKPVFDGQRFYVTNNTLEAEAVILEKWMGKAEITFIQVC